MAAQPREDGSMLIGVPKERMLDEFRVGLTPPQVGSLVAAGHVYRKKHQREA